MRRFNHLASLLRLDRQVPYEFPSRLMLGPGADLIDASSYVRNTRVERRLFALTCVPQCTPTIKVSPIEFSDTFWDIEGRDTASSVVFAE